MTGWTRVNGLHSEAVVEDAALAWLRAVGSGVLHGTDIGAGEPAAERAAPNSQILRSLWRSWPH